MKPLEAIGNVALVVLAVAAASIAWKVVVTPPRGSRVPPAAFVRDWRSYAAGGHEIGDPGGSVVVTEFLDFQCPFCREFASVSRHLAKSPSVRVSIRFHHFPLSTIHPAALAAARVAECAQEQGRFRELHDALFAAQAQLDQVNLDSLAHANGVANRVAFAECMRSDRPDRRIAHDLELGRRLDVRGTPTFLINGRRIEGALSLAELDRAVRLAMAESTNAARKR